MVAFFQEAVLFWLSGLATPGMDRIMLLITESYLIVIPLLILALSLTMRARKAEESLRRNFICRAAGGVLLTFLAVSFIKSAIAEPRPCMALPVHNPVGCELGGSFPSMHAALAFSVLPFTSGLLGRAYFLYASLVGISRMYLGLHYPLDVLAGAVLGFLAGRLIQHM